MEKIQNREDINDKYKWDLTKIYKTDDEFLKEIKKAEKEITKLSKYKDIMLKDGKNLYETIDKLFSVSRIIEKIYTYAHLKGDEDISNPHSIELLSKAETLYIKFNQETSYFDPILLSIDYKQIEKMIKEYPKLKEYEIYLNKMFRFQKYKLSEIEEKLISNLSKIYSDNAKSHLFSRPKKKLL